MTENAELMRQSRQDLEGRWESILAVCAVPILYQSLVSGGSYMSPDTPITILNIFILGPLNFGLSRYCLNFSRGNEAEFGQIFQGFNFIGKNIIANLLIGILITLAAILFIIPGVIVGLMFSQTYFILSDNEDMGAWEAMQLSKEMMRGNKTKLFFLSLRFFGWFLLCLLSLGIGFFILSPYYNLTLAKFYDDIKGNVYVDQY
ncbi:DUF975 family protein [Flammeovirga kamogawensis]|uniref:DUF975 family protein n=1 Tax=Flammeovirga kamogawensis TaxID=373891 RepID=A0ABX8H1B6_9BACT|nr:DUF975 family protein [Flammeovirga kamogawensis]MBB6462567.1 putative membrane protein [Flammeovirga kamogawensis]QWG09684.1 DUF975 family protein [Flammeovirga kamogawensis]TRX65196.1 DUF975 family protein [Flammeovirga kamogawensis]